MLGQGLGLAVPVNAATRGIIGALMRDGRVRRAYLGIAGGARPLPPGAREHSPLPTGVEVIEVVPGTPAERAGLRPEDLIVAIDGTAIGGVDDLQRLMVADAIGRAVGATVIRQGRLVRVELTPVELTI
jgi:S1-C subfamily serine protease